MTATQAPVSGAPPATRPPGLMAHQEQIYDFLTSRPYAGAWLSIGGGKTVATLRALQFLRPQGHILVIAPVAIARSTWIDQIEQWRIPIRTRSLIVDENDRKLSKARRLQRFGEVFTDPPTMYFVNQEMITQPSQPERLLVPRPGTVPPAGVSAEIAEMLDLLRARGPLSAGELIEAHRDLVAARAAGPVPPKSRAQAWIRELTTLSLVDRKSHPCRSCAGEGCASCRYGLVDQMPRQRVPDPSRPGETIEAISWPFATMIIDESQAFKSHSSSRFKALRSVRPAISRVIELTGTPAPNGVHDLWSQIYLLDQGEALGRNITAFRKRWFTARTFNGVPTKWLPNPGVAEEIYAAVSHLVMSAQNTSLSLPDVTVEDVNVTLPVDLMAAYREFRRELVLDVVVSRVDPDDPNAPSVSTIVAQNRAVLTSKLLQFASGTIYTDPENNPGAYEVLHTEKLEMLEYLIRNTVSLNPAGGAVATYKSPVLVAYHFRSDQEQILGRLRQAGYDVEAFDGSRDMVRRWNASQIPVMLLHPAAAGHGVNLQHGGHTLVWYTLTENLEHYLQTNGRLHRTGQTEPVTIYRLITKMTRDADMPALLESKQRAQDHLISAVDADRFELRQLTDEISADLEDLRRSRDL